MIKIGVRVIRGPDWDHKNHEDGGPGHLGTIIDINRKDQTCVVQWDNGHLSSDCQATSDHQDLRIVYTESTVTKAFSHFGYCDSCNIREQNITGLRFKCVTCKDFDLCMKCYMADEHDKTHSFVRINSRLSRVIPILPRIKMKRSKIYGFGPGAAIMLTAFAASSHTEDIGRIKEVNESDSGTVNIEWPKGETTTQSRGKDGVVEIKLVETHHVGHVYVDHLPVADLSLPVDAAVNIGDRVCVDLNTDTFKGLMQDYGGWQDDMENIMGETGEVVGFRDGSALSCEVYFKKVSRPWMIYIAALTKISVPTVGDRVTVLADVGTVRKRQGYKWKDNMRNLIGKSGTVESVDEIGDLTVEFPDGLSFVFNPSCVVKNYDEVMSQRQQSSTSDSTSNNENVTTQNHSDDQDLRRASVQEEVELVPVSVLVESDSSSDDDYVSSDEEDVPRIINTSLVIAPGLRVVRGRDWKWNDQDGGDGHLGTVQDISQAGETSIPERCATVQWDNGLKNTYRIGYEDSYDLRIYDNAGVAGNRHRDMKCTEPTCEELEDEIIGFVWKCLSDSKVILCNTCYLADKGDVTQPFCRIDYPGHKGVKVPKRQMSQRQKLLGIDVGARVVRGVNWRWAEQDGGDGREGEVIAIVNFSLDTDHDAAEVTWENDHTNVYRLGYEGSVDLKYKMAGSVRYYYPLHLPELKMPEEAVHVPRRRPEPSEVPSEVPEAEDDGRLIPGNKVQIGVDPDVLQSIHKEMKMWSDSMLDTIGVTGTVQEVNGNIVTVRFGSSELFTMHEMTLKKVDVFREGEFVKVMKDFDEVQKLQNGHGDWNELTIKSLGKNGQVECINSDGDVKVKFSDRSLTFNPECLSRADGPIDTLDIQPLQKVPQKQPPQKVTQVKKTEEVTLQQQPVKVTQRQRRDPSVPFKTAVEDGTEDDVLNHLDLKPTREEKQQMVRGQANFHPVYTACKNGHAGVLKALLSFADAVALEEGDGKSTPLQIAVKTKHVDCVDLLLNHGVDKNAVNDHSQSAVHLAVQNRDVATLRVLRKHQCDINQKDALGDSAVVDAIVRQQDNNMEMLDVILDWPDINLDFENKNGFSPIHIAARKGDLGALKSILKKDPRLLNKEKSDGYTPLHLAACMDHHEVIQFLLNQPGLIIDATTKDKEQTALLIACYYGSKKTVEILLNGKNECQADVKDIDDNNVLHLCLSGPPQVMEIADIQRSGQRFEEDKQIKHQLDIAQILLDKGVPHIEKNKAGKSPEKVASSEKLKTEFIALLKERSKRDQHQLCPLCQEDGNEVYAVFLIEPCGCSLCNGCFMPKFKKCPNCGNSIEAYNKLKRK